MDVVGSGAQRDRLAREYEETFFASFYLVNANRNVAQQKASRSVGFAAECLTAAALERDFRGGDGPVIFVQKNPPAIGRNGRQQSARSRKTWRNQERCE